MRMTLCGPEGSNTVVNVSDVSIETGAARLGFELRVSFGNRSGNTYTHWHFHDGNDRDVLHYWPLNGTWWCKSDGRKGRTADVSVLLQILASLPN
jgi:hypothetical protein